MTRVLLVEDHASFRESLAFLLNREPDFDVVAQAGTVADAASLDGIDFTDLRISLQGSFSHSRVNFRLRP